MSTINEGIGGDIGGRGGGRQRRRRRREADFSYGDPVETFERGRRGRAGGYREAQRRGGGGDDVNVGSAERAVSVAAGSILAVLGASRRSVPGLITAGVGAALVYRGATGSCPAYRALNIDTSDTAEDGGYRDSSVALMKQRRIEERGIHVEQAFTVNRSPEDLYAYWRNFENLPRIMSYLQEVRILDDRRSRWVAKAPAVAGGSVEWEAEITADEPGRLIAWRSLPGSTISTVGQVRFGPARGDRGTEVRVSMEYLPPAGRVGHWVAKLFGKSPRTQIREDLRKFKRMMEIGEIPTTEGQPQGACTKQARLQTAE